jgi:hypothetical protein
MEGCSNHSRYNEGMPKDPDDQEPVVNIGIKEKDLGVKESALNLLFEVIYTCLYIMNQHIIIASVISVNLHFTAYIID